MRLRDIETKIGAIDNTLDRYVGLAAGRG